MKVKKWIEVGTEVTVSIDSEDIRAALMEDAPTTDASAKALLNRVAHALDAITPEIIAGMGAPARTVIHAFLSKQAARYIDATNVPVAPPADGGAPAGGQSPGTGVQG